MKSICFLATVVLVLVPTSVFAQTPISFPDKEFTVQAPPTNLVTTGSSGGTRNMNTFLGANRYTENIIPVTGQSTVTTNVEAGHFWNGHETLQHVPTNSTHFTQTSQNQGAGEIAPLFDRHATWAAMLIGGRVSEDSPNPVLQQGIAPGTDLRSAAIATQWNGNAYALSFGISVDTYVNAFATAFSQSDVINSSFGYGDSAGQDILTVFTDALAAQNSFTTFVASSGNSGPGDNTIGAPAAGYNSIAVGALTGSEYNSPASFSSRGPQDFGYYGENGFVTTEGVRAGVDISAPGTDLTSAFYGGQTGGNDVSLTGSTDQGSNPEAYSASINGTSFSAPLVAGGAALVTSAANTLPGLSLDPFASHSQVVRALLMTGSDPTADWDNGMEFTTLNGNTVWSTTQGLDWATGAGRMNLERTFDIQVNGQSNVALDPGGSANVETRGWDFGLGRIGMVNDYILDTYIPAQSDITLTLAWMRERFWDSETGDLYENAQADLNLSLWRLDAEGNYDRPVAQSISEYNTAEHIRYVFEESGLFGIRVSYENNSFDNTFNSIWGSEGLEQEYGLAWELIVIPEPATLVLMAIIGLILCITHRRASITRKHTATKRLSRISRLS